MKTIKLDDFELEAYESYNDIHNNIINNLSKDANTKKYLGDLNYLITRINNRYQENYVDTLFIAKYNDLQIGIITICIRDEKYEIDYGILPEYRNKHLASLLVSEFTQKVFETYQNVDKIYLKIETDNVVSQKVAIRNGYVKETNDLFFKSR